MTLATRLALADKIFAPEWLRLRKTLEQHSLGNVPWKKLWAVTPHERLRLRCMLDALVAELYGLEWDDLAWILRDCDYPPEILTDGEFYRTLDPKGFWRVDKEQPPELRQTVLTLVAFHDLKHKIRLHGDRDFGIDAFCIQNADEGWMLPETLRLADYGLGHDERAEHPQPVREHFKARFYDWQLEQTVEDSWAECSRHAENLLGAELVAIRLAETASAVDNQARQAHLPASQPTPTPPPKPRSDFMLPGFQDHSITAAAVAQVQPGEVWRVHATYEDFVRLMEELPARRASRVAYCDGILEVTIPSSKHEYLKSILHDTVLGLADELDLEAESFGSMTWMRKDTEAGGEPDDCFYLYRDLAEKPPREIDLNQDRVPQLVIEIDVASPSLVKDRLYAAYGVPEIWRYHDKKNTFDILCLRDGAYRAADQSECLPGVTADDIREVLRESETLSNRKAIKNCREKLQARVKAR